MCIFGKPIIDLIPILPGKYQPHPVWRESLLTREEEVLRHHHMVIPTNGVVIKVCQYRQYVIRIDGSGRITLRNHKFLQKFTPIHQLDGRRSILDDLKYLPTSDSSDQSPSTPTTSTLSYQFSNT